MKRLLGAAAIAGFASLAAAQTTVNPEWKVQTGAYSWFPSSGDVVRCMDVVPGGSVLVASNATPPSVHRLNQVTGAEVLPAMDNSTYSGGERIASNISVADDGVIYVCNLNAAGGQPKLYRHANELAVATVAYSGATTSNRFGSDVDAKGSGANTRILICGDGTQLLLCTTTDGVTFTGSLITPTSPALTAGIQELSFDPGSATNDYWVRLAGASNFQRYSGVTNTGNGTLPFTGSNYGPMHIAGVGSQKYLILGISDAPAGTTGKAHQIRRVSDDAYLYACTGAEFSGGAKANANGYGETAYDLTTNRSFFLWGNNSIAAYKNTVPVGMSGLLIE